jgi:hypothetical protein
MADGSRSSPAPEPPPSSDTTRGGERGERAIAAVGALFRRFGRWIVRFTGESLRAWRYLDFEQRVAGIGALLLIVSTFGPFSFVEAAIVLVGLAVLLLLKKRADGRSFHLPFGDGAVIMAAGAWSALLIVIRLFDRPLGQNLLALVCAAILTLAGLRMRLRRPMDDLPEERRAERDAEHDPDVEIEFASLPGSGDTAETQALPRGEERTEPLRDQPPPPPQRRPTEPPPEGPPARVRRQTPAARRSPPPPAVDPPTAVRPSELPPPPPERADPDFDLPAPEEKPPVGPPAPKPRRPAPPPPAPEADEGPFRTRPADNPPRRRSDR